MKKQIKDTFQILSSSLRRANNRLVGFCVKSSPLRPKAEIETVVGALSDRLPFVAGKIGGAELMALEYGDHRIRPPWPAGWSWRRPARRLMNNAGFFPVQKRAFYRWQTIMRDSIAATDILCAWQTDPFLEAYEKGLIHELAPGSRNFPLEQLGRPLVPVLLPFRWLVVSPFVQSVRRQLPKLRMIHDPEGRVNGDWEGPVKTCELVRCPFQVHLEPSPYQSWEEGLERLSEEILKKKFDVALIGAGAWSLPLAARIKKTGRSAIHFGGETQLLFGIKGKRWENYGIYNDAWISADPSEMPVNRDRVEQGCYW